MVPKRDLNIGDSARVTCWNPNAGELKGGAQKLRLYKICSVLGTPTTVMSGLFFHDPMEELKGKKKPCLKRHVGQSRRVDVHGRWLATWMSRPGS